MFVAKALEYTLRRVVLLTVNRSVLLQNTVDDIREGGQFRAFRWLASPISRRFRMPQHLPHRLARNDNPFSEAQFKTLKYHPSFPGRFHDLTAAIAFCRSFFPWYNTEHRHAGIAMLTPDDVHHHRAHSVLEQRKRTLQAAWTHHPERFVRGVPQPDPLPQAVWINPPATTTTGETAQ